MIPDKMKKAKLSALDKFDSMLDDTDAMEGKRIASKRSAPSDDSAPGPDDASETESSDEGESSGEGSDMPNADSPDTSDPDGSDAGDTAEHPDDAGDGPSGDDDGKFKADLLALASSGNAAAQEVVQRLGLDAEEE
jgi:hypothetical protein